MRSLCASELLGVWERGASQALPDRALHLLAAQFPDTPRETLEGLAIGKRDSHLLALRRQIFGSRLISLVNCSQCGARVELSFDTADITVIPGIETGEEFSLTSGEYNIRFRLPNSSDLKNITGCTDLAKARHCLLERCVSQIDHCDNRIAVDDLPEEVVTAIMSHMAEADPQADVQLALACPACQLHWVETFDIVSFFWSEIHAWASRLLREVHALASAYGWAEADLLAMHPLRRQSYLEMLGE